MQCCQDIWPHKCLPALLAVLALTVACFTGVSAGTAQAATTPGNAALDWAEGHTIGDPFVFGGTGPAYDCSGLVFTAFRAEGITLPRDTYGMVDSPMLVRTWNPHRGDLAFFGPVGAPDHVAFVTIWRDTMFGAENTGTRVGWYSTAYWPPTAFYSVR